MEVDYTDLVSNTEGAMRRVLAFCELDWDKNCAEIDTAATSRERDTVRQVTGPGQQDIDLA